MRVVNIAEDDLNEEERALVAQGKLRPPLGPLPDSFFAMPAPRVSRQRAVAAVSQDRDED